jgi:Fungalysin/Thermolysin Propeptide Motif
MPPPATRIDRPTSAPIIAGTPSESLRWSGWIEERLGDGRLALKSRWSDPLVTGRIVERFEQRHGGVPVYGAEVVLQRRGDTLEAVFGATEEITVGEGGPAMTPASARRAIEHAAAISLPRDREPSLFIVRQPDGGATRAYCDRVLAHEGPRTVCVDSGDGRPALTLDETRRQARQGNRHLVYRLEDDESIVGYVNGLTPLSARDLAVPEAGSTAEAVRDHQAVLATAWMDRFGIGDLIESRPIVTIVRPAGGKLPGPMYLGRGVLQYPEGSVLKDDEGRGRVAHELSHVLIDRSSRLLPVGEAATLEEDFAILMEELAAGRRRADAGPVRTAFWDAADDMPAERARIEHAFVRAFTRLIPRAATPALARAAVLSAYAGLGGSADRLAESWRAR